MKFAEYIIMVTMMLLGVSYTQGDRVVLLGWEQPFLGYVGWLLILMFGSLLCLNIIIDIRRLRFL